MCRRNTDFPDALSDGNPCSKHGDDAVAKGYWIVNNLVRDAEAYDAYRAANAAPLSRYGGRFLVRAGRQTVTEGAAHPRSVVIEFPSHEAALACYNDPEYQAAIALRAAAADGTFIIVEGYSG